MTCLLSCKILTWLPRWSSLSHALQIGVTQVDTGLGRLGHDELAIQGERRAWYLIYLLLQFFMVFDQVPSALVNARKNLHLFHLDPFVAHLS